MTEGSDRLLPLMRALLVTGIVLTGATGVGLWLTGVLVACVGLVAFALAAYRTAPGAGQEPYRPTP
jgi:hypothetical protein